MKHNMDELLVGLTKQMLLRKKQSLVHGNKEHIRQTKVNHSLILLKDLKSLHILEQPALDKQLLTGHPDKGKDNPDEDVSIFP